MPKEKEEKPDLAKKRRQEVVICLRSVDEKFVKDLNIEQAFSLLVLLTGSLERIHQQILTRPKEEQEKLAVLFQEIAKKIAS